MEIAFASREVLDYIGIDGCFFRSDGGITHITHPIQISGRNMLVFSASAIRGHGFVVFRLKDGSENSVPVHTGEVSDRDEISAMRSVFTCV